ncbi:hypothetical protein CDAR_10781 [Caerostris darwini]|uniref:Uncharacterized protein n=1 Tax=Caerostris darwini TaxID=1538125 RepID=A0AAV4V5T9_9ARAC|nr:hypothetical protein CDAR_10781 [Caerostris darwini]
MLDILRSTVKINRNEFAQHGPFHTQEPSRMVLQWRSLHVLSQRFINIIDHSIRVGWQYRCLNRCFRESVMRFESTFKNPSGYYLPLFAQSNFQNIPDCIPSSRNNELPRATKMHDVYFSRGGLRYVLSLIRNQITFCRMSRVIMVQ